MKYGFKLNIKKSMKHHCTGRWLREKRIMGVALKMNEFGVYIGSKEGRAANLKQIQK